VNQPVDETGLGRCNAPSGQDVSRASSRLNLTILEQTMQGLECIGLLHAVVMLEGEVGFGHDEVRENGAVTAPLEVVEERDSRRGLRGRLASQQSKHDRRIKSDCHARPPVRRARPMLRRMASIEWLFTGIVRCWRLPTHVRDRAGRGRSSQWRSPFSMRDSRSITSPGFRPSASHVSAGNVAWRLLVSVRWGMPESYGDVPYMSIET